MMTLKRSLIVFAMLLAALRTPPAAAQSILDDGPAEFSLSIGYANISLGSDSAIDNDSALRFEPSVSFSPIRQLPQLRLGGDVGVSMVLDNSTRTIISSNGTLIFAGSSDVPLWLLEPELRLSWRQTFGSDHQFFIEPGVAGGAVFGFLDLDSSDHSQSYDADASTFYGRVFLRAGALVPGGTAGFEASWLSGGKLDFGGNASGDVREFYVGFFGALMF
jgi:hypothetical protein